MYIDQNILNIEVCSKVDLNVLQNWSCHLLPPRLQVWHQKVLNHIASLVLFPTTLSIWQLYSLAVSHSIDLWEGPVVINVGLRLAGQSILGSGAQILFRSAKDDLPAKHGQKNTFVIIKPHEELAPATQADKGKNSKLLVAKLDSLRIDLSDHETKCENPYFQNTLLQVKDCLDLLLALMKQQIKWVAVFFQFIM